MRSNTQPSFKYAVLAVASAAALFGLAGCGSSSDTATPIEVPLSPPVQALTSVAKYNLVLRNSATGALITDSVAITLSGAGTVNVSNAPTTSFTTTNGLQAFATAPGVAAGGTIRVSTQSRAAGWTDGDATITISASDNVQNVEIRLTNITRVAEIPAAVPVAAVAAPVATTGGATTAVVAAATTPKVVSVPGGGTSTIAAASVSIPAATRITNAAGQTPTGALQVTVIAPSLNTPEGQAAIPGDTAADGTLLTIGGLMTNLMTDATGARFTNFSSPVTARMPIATGTRTQDGARLLAAGDTAPIYVWNDTTKRLDFRTNGTVVSTPSGLVAEYPKSSFSRDVFGLASPVGVCDVTVNITGRPAGDTRVVEVRVRLSSARSTANSVTFSGVRTIFGSPSPPNSVSLEGGAPSYVNLACGPNTIPVVFPPLNTGSIVVNTGEACTGTGAQARALPTIVTAVSGNGEPTSVTTTGSAGTPARASATITGLAAGTYSVTPPAVANRTTPAAQNVVVGTGAATANFDYGVACGPATGGG